MTLERGRIAENMLSYRGTGAISCGSNDNFAKKIYVTYPKTTFHFTKLKL